MMLAIGLALLGLYGLVIFYLCAFLGESKQ
jgi:hypothetical protein